jgi:hypothetical protein
MLQRVAFARLASYFTFACSKESNQRREHPAAACFLRFSLKRAAAELALSALKQSSPKTPALAAMLGAAKGLKSKANHTNATATSFG